MEHDAFSEHVAGEGLAEKRSGVRELDARAANKQIV